MYGQVHRVTATPSFSPFVLLPRYLNLGYFQLLRGDGRSLPFVVGNSTIRLGKTWITYRSSLLLNKCITSILPHAVFLPVGWRTQNPSSYVQRRENRGWSPIVLGSCHQSKLNGT